MLQKTLTVLGPQAHFPARQPRRLLLWRTPVVKECAIPVKGSHCNGLCFGPNPLYKKELVSHGACLRTTFVSTSGFHNIKSHGYKIRSSMADVSHSKDQPYVSAPRAA
jgi:hypothetical protein